MATAVRPRSYQIVVELGWRWAAAARQSVIHLVPPEGDRARCGAVVPRHSRVVVTKGIALNGCRKCMADVGIEARP